MTNDPIKPYAWFSHTPKPAGTGGALVVVQMLVGLLVAAAFWMLGHRTAATIVAILAVGIAAASLVSPVWHARIGAFFAYAGHWVGRILGVVILSPIFLIGFTAARGWMRLTGADPLRLRERDSVSYWLACDRDERKVRHIAAMFATEAPVCARRRWLPVFAAILVLALAGEGVLRWVGFGRTILYVPDAIVGYYPAPNQRTTWLGRRIDTNRYGMRAPDYPDPKNPGTLRILMIGDSTLWGGLYIDQNDLYARRLERMLSDAAGGRTVQVWNIAGNAWGPFHELGYVQRFGTHHADVAVICLPINDVFRPLYGLEQLSFMTPDRPPRCAWEEVFFHLVWRYREGRLGKPDDDSRRIQSRRGVDAYVRLARLLQKSGCEVMVEILPSRQGGLTDTPPIDKKRRSETLRAALASAGITVGYPVGLFRGSHQSDAIYHDHVHLDRAGHHAYAGYLVRRLSSASHRIRAWLDDDPSASVMASPGEDAP